MIRPLALGAAGLLAACTPTPAANESAPPADNAQAGAGDGIATCDAARVADVVGKRAADVGEDARRRAGAAVLRTIAPGQAVTMDYRTDRLNLETDASGVITAVRCG